MKLRVSKREWIELRSSIDHSFVCVADLLEVKFLPCNVNLVRLNHVLSYGFFPGLSEGICLQEFHQRIQAFEATLNFIHEWMNLHFRVLINEPVDRFLSGAKLHQI